MKVSFLAREDSMPCSDFVVVIDVISAFTTAAWLFAQNAAAVMVAETAAHARALKLEDSRRCLVGEEGGLPIEGFDFPNDATAFRGIDFSGRTCVMKTSSGTKGLMANLGARHLLAASLCNARATADYIRTAEPESVSFVITNNFKSAEDLACAGYICDHLFNECSPDSSPYRQLVNGSRYAEDTRTNGTGEMVCILEADRFDFAMICRTDHATPTIRPSKPVAG